MSQNKGGHSRRGFSNLGTHFLMRNILSLGHPVLQNRYTRILIIFISVSGKYLTKQRRGESCTTNANVLFKVTTTLLP